MMDKVAHDAKNSLPDIFYVRLYTSSSETGKTIYLGFNW